MQKPKSNDTFLKNFVVTSIAVGISSTVCRPFERIRFFFLTPYKSSNNEFPKNLSRNQYILEIIKKEGIQTLWKSNWTLIMNQYLPLGVTFSLFELLKTQNKYNYIEKNFLSIPFNLAAGGLVGFIERVIRFPYAVAVDNKVNITMLAPMMKTYGVGNVLRAFDLTGLSRVIHKSFYFGIYEAGKNFGGNHRNDLAYQSIVAYTSAHFAALLSGPFEYAAKESMTALNANPKAEIKGLEIFKKTIKEKGWGVMFRNNNTSDWLTKTRSGMILVLFDRVKDYLRNQKVL